MMEDKYTINPFDTFLHNLTNIGSLFIGDCIDMVTGAIVMGPYCEWPKKEPRRDLL